MNEAKMGQAFCKLRALVQNNLEFFNQCNKSHGSRFAKVLVVLRDHLESIEKDVEVLHQVAPLYDLDENTPGNGFRSYVSIVDAFLDKTISICRAVESNRNGVFFRADNYCRELESATSIFGGFKSGLSCLHKMLKSNKPGELFSPDGNLSAEELLDEYVTLDQTGFYGRHLGFYYCESMKRILLGVSVGMASFSDLYQKTGGAVAHAASSVINGGKYFLFPEAKAKQIVHIAQNASVGFIKAFWSLNESHLLKQVPHWLCPKLAVNEDVYVLAKPQELPDNLGGSVEIPVASSHLPPGPIRCRLLSHVHRKGQATTERVFSSSSLHDPSPGLLFHCHGGGFVSQTPETHEIYLRDWARDLNVPIFSVDYSLAPLAPFPRALEEVLQAYAWALLNKERLGWTGEKVVVAGDSAGGNLVLGLTLKCIDLGIRVPDSVFCVYTPLILDMVPSPSRILCVLDPLLPLGFMLSCLDSYAGIGQHVVDDPFVEEPKDGNTQTDSVRRSRNSSVIAVLDTGIKAIRRLSYLDVEERTVDDEVFPANDEETCSRRTSRNNSAVRDKLNRRPTALTETSAPTAGSYTDDFVYKYLKSSSYLQDSTRVDQEEHLIYEVPSDITFNLRRQCCKVTRKYVDKLTNAVTSNGFYKRYLALTPIADSDDSPKVPWFQESRLTISRKFRRIKLVASDPFMSPYLAPDEMLEQMPPVYLVSPSYDPTLDDSVMFARRLRQLNRQVSLSFVDKLPHGFLNFLPFSKEVHDGSKLCVSKIKEGFGFPL